MKLVNPLPAIGKKKNPTPKRPNLILSRKKIINDAFYTTNDSEDDPVEDYSDDEDLFSEEDNMEND